MTPTVLQVLQEGLDRWGDEADISFSQVVENLIEYLELNYPALLIHLGVSFQPRAPNDGEATMRARTTNAQRFRRWLKGAEKGAAQMPCELVIPLLGGFPSRLRMSMANLLMAPFDLMVNARPIADPTMASLQDMSIEMGRESIEAQHSLYWLPVDPTEQQVRTTFRELVDARTLNATAIETLIQRYPFLRHP